MVELSATTIGILALSKLILFVYAIVEIVAFIKKARPLTHVILTTLAVSIFYSVLAQPLQQTLWNNAGDENLVLAFLTTVRQGSPFADFYYGWLPPFYPPLYFWIIGCLSKFVTATSVGAAKLGVSITLLLWFITPYYLQRWYWKKNVATHESTTVTQPWFWFLIPAILFVMLDFDTIISKPYEVFPAMLAVILAGLIAEALKHDRWRWQLYGIFGVAAGFLILEFYYWWILIIPVLFGIAARKKKSLINLFIVFCVSGIVVLPYIVPLLISFMHFGYENWQSRFFVPQDFFSFIPWQQDFVRSVMAILGVVGLALGFRKQRFITVSALILVFCYVYQIGNLVLYLSGGYTAIPSKPFLFLGTACLAIGCAYMFFEYLVPWVSERCSIRTQQSVALIAFFVVLPLFPFGNFIESSKLLNQIEKDLTVPSAAGQAEMLAQQVPDWQERIWLVSDEPSFAPYLALSYYIAYSPHYSHPAAQYSRRLSEIRALVNASTQEEFLQLIDQGTPRPIDALYLYSDPDTDAYQLFFWRDAYPNGGKEMRIDISHALITDDHWKKVSTENSWTLWIKK